VGVAGTLVSQPDHPVTLAVTLPSGYGLTAEEKKEGAPALNGERRAEVALQGSTFVAEMPPVLYCTHRFSWRPVPPPPAWFILRFSDAPDEQYVVWRSGRRAGVYVSTPDGVEVRSDMVSWNVEPGEFRFLGREGVETRWLLDVRLEPRRSGPSGEKRTM
jgi:hypothetical protein